MQMKVLILACLVSVAAVVPAAHALVRVDSPYETAAALKKVANHRPDYPKDPSAWAAAIREAMQRLRGVKADKSEWLYLKNDVVVRPPRGVDMALRLQLLEEMQFAEAQMVSDGLVERIAKAPSFDEGGLGVLIGITREARERNLPEQVVAEVRQAASQKAGELLRPQLKAIVEANPEVDPSLEGLFAIRRALSPVLAYSSPMIEEFGAFDPEGVLQPLFQKIEAVERMEQVRSEFQVEMLKLTDKEESETAINGLVARAFGPGPHGSHIEDVKTMANQAILLNKGKGIARMMYFPQVLQDVADGNVQTHQDLPEKAPFA